MKTWTHVLDNHDYQALWDLILLFGNGMEFVIWDVSVCDNWLTYRIKSNHTHTIKENAKKNMNFKCVHVLGC